jgi:hypothetical protein
VVPADPVGDNRCVPALLPGATCDVRLNRAGGTDPSARLVGDVRPDKIGGVSPRRVLQLDLLSHPKIFNFRMSISFTICSSINRIF